MQIYKYLNIKGLIKNLKKDGGVKCAMWLTAKIMSIITETKKIVQ